MTDRAQREAREREAALAERRRRRLWQLGATVVVAGAIVAIAIAIGSAGDNPGTVTGPPEGVAEVNALFRGIPQRDFVLGDPSAPATLVEFADLQCPFCGEFARDVLPDVVRRYVRTGRVRLMFRALAFIGDGKQSERAARMALAAGEQDKQWQFAELVFRNQGDEDAGWVTDDYLRRIGTAVGLDVERAFRDRDGPRVTGLLAGSKHEAKVAGIESTPSFTVQLPGGKARLLPVDDPGSAEKFTKRLDEALAGE